MIRSRGMRIRTRLTLQYAALFAVSGCILLFVVYQLMRIDSVRIVQTSGEFDPDGFTIDAFSVSQQASPDSFSHSAEDEVLMQSSQMLDSMLQWSAVCLVAMTVISFVLGWILAGRALRPMQEISETARNLNGVQLGDRIRLAGPRDEIRELSDTIDAMLERIEAAFDSERRMVATISHELRTPLANQRAALEVCELDGDASCEELRRALSIALEQNQRAARVVESMLLLAQMSEAPAGDCVAVGLTSIITEVVLEQPVPIEALQLRWQPAEELLVQGNLDLLQIMVRNLLDNALRHNEPDGWVEVELVSKEVGVDARIVPDGSTSPNSTNAESVTLTISNSGPQISEEVASELTLPFRRGTRDRVGSDTGVGLGLSIVQSIAEFHGGTLTVTPRSTGGLIVQVQLGVAASA